MLSSSSHATLAGKSSIINAVAFALLGYVPSQRRQEQIDAALQELEAGIAGIESQIAERRAELEQPRGIGLAARQQLPGAAFYTHPGEKLALCFACVHLEGQAKLLEVVHALDAAGRLTSRLNGREQKTNQNGDDGDDHQQLDQREAATRRG